MFVTGRLQSLTSLWPAWSRVGPAWLKSVQEKHIVTAQFDSARPKVQMEKKILSSTVQNRQNTCNVTGELIIGGLAVGSSD